MSQIIPYFYAYYTLLSSLVPTHPLTHSPTHPPTHSLTHSSTHPLTHSPTHPLTHSSPTHPPTHSLIIHSHTYSHTHTLPHPLTLSFTYAYSVLNASSRHAHTTPTHHTLTHIIFSPFLVCSAQWSLRYIPLNLGHPRSCTRSSVCSTRYLLRKVVV